MIRIDAVWLATEPMDMRGGTDTALAQLDALVLGLPWQRIGGGGIITLV